MIGVPDEEMGERVVAFVAAGRRAPSRATSWPAELTAYARERIAALQGAAGGHFRDELPRTPTGKMVKGRLREEYVRAVTPQMPSERPMISFWISVVPP